MHDTMAREKAALPPQTRCMALAGALLVELVDLGMVGVGSEILGTQPPAEPTDDNGLSLYVIPLEDRSTDPIAIEGYDSRGHLVTLRPRTAWDLVGRPLDPALREMYDSILRESGAAGGPGHRQASGTPSFSAGVSQYRTDGYADRPQHRRPVPAPRAPSNAETPGRGGLAQRPPAAVGRHSGPSVGASLPAVVPVRVLLEGWAAGGRSENLVVNRLIQAGLVRLETQYRMLHSDRQVIVPQDSVVSGRPITRITGGLHAARAVPGSGFDRRTSRGLTAYDKKLGGLFAAAGLFDLERTSLTVDEMRSLRQQLRDDFPPDLARLLRQVHLAIKNLAVIR
ncbi:hypothetical protein SAMN04489716_6994 [Actinoplanes derwentensis]|uniref:Uncharacterized protein n=2 Tax=Actinoplanes derwentensis TaxID=113562 RepID=A0A1H2CW30_9ACTN|nr:hypothetical protein SAMN04489716_6994 [Actinoplanes derwentensis]